MSYDCVSLSGDIVSQRFRLGLIRLQMWWMCSHYALGEFDLFIQLSFPLFIFLGTSKHKEFRLLLETWELNTTMLDIKLDLFAHKFIKLVRKKLVKEKINLLSWLCYSIEYFSLIIELLLFFRQQLQIFFDYCFSYVRINILNIFGLWTIHQDANLGSWDCTFSVLTAYSITLTQSFPNWIWWVPKHNHKTSEQFFHCYEKKLVVSGYFAAPRFLQHWHFFLNASANYYIQEKHPGKHGCSTL